MGLISYGRITKSHGLSGEVKLQPLSRQPNNLIRLERIFLQQTPGQPPKEIKVLRIRPQKDHAIIELEGVDSIDAAEELKGVVVLVDEADLGDLEEDEYYWFELIGLDVYSEDGTLIGRVDDLMDRSFQSILIIKNEDKEFLVPLTEPFIKEVNLKESKIIISPIEGLLE